MSRIPRTPSAFSLAVGLFLVGLISVFAVRLTAQAQCGSPLACFEAGVEGELWQALTPFGQINDPAICENSDPALPPDLDRTCNGEAPPLGQFLYPYGIAVDGARIFVTDQFNHRVQAFSFDGTPIPLASPIGDGRFRGDLTHLHAPEGLTIMQDADGNHILAVADAYNYRLAFFRTADGTPAFGEHFPMVSSIDGSQILPSGIAASPGATIQPGAVDAGGVNFASDQHRLVVTDRLNCYVNILDEGLHVLRTIPAAPPEPDDPVLGPYVVSQGACVVPAVDQSTNLTSFPPLGYFGSATGVAVDGAGHIFVADYDNSRIQILDIDGTPLGSFGTPPDPSTLPPDAPPPPGTLQHPWSVLIDHLGRVAVTDFDNERVAYFTVDFATTPPTVVYQFQLNAAGSLNGHPTGIAEQAGAVADGLDPAGRLVVSDLVNQRVQRFQLPDLGIANIAIDPSSNPPSGTYAVVVPSQKAAPVTGVTSTVTGVNANASAPMPQAPADTLSQIDIQPGQMVTYGFTYNATGSPVSFLIDAVGNVTGVGATHAHSTAIPTSKCTDCASTAAMMVAGDPTVPATLSEFNWYHQNLDVQITATSSTGLSAIAYQFLLGPEVAVYGGAMHQVTVSGTSATIDVTVDQPGTSTMQYWAVNADGSVEQPAHLLTLSLDTSPPGAALSFPAPTGYDALGKPWHDGPISVVVNWTDDLSGTTTANSTLVFSLEGRGQFSTLQGTDRAGNMTPVLRSDENIVSGQPVNIDTNAPQFVAGALPSGPVTIELTGPGTGVLVAGSAADNLFKSWTQNPTAMATDGLLATGEAGSGVVSISVPNTGSAFPMVGAGPTTTLQAITATDGAGNATTAMVDVVVQDTTPPVLSCPATLNVSIAANGSSVTIPNVLATVTASDLSGSFTLAQAPLAGSGTFTTGNHTVSVTATDPSNNTSSPCLITVVVADVTPPVITTPSPVVEATSPAGAIVNYVATAVDNVDPNPVLTCSPAAGSQFAQGNTTVNCTATDASGNSSTASFQVVVRDTTPPVVVTPSPIVEATGPAGAIVNYVVSVSDAADPNPVTICAPASGSPFALGNTTVHCSATDVSGNTTPATFVVKVQDTTNPVITTPSPVVEATSAAGAIVSYIVTASDVVSGAVATTCSPVSGSQFALGNTTVSCSAADGAGNTATKSFAVVVRDTTPPVITTPTPAPVVEATGPAGATVSFTVTALDIVSGSIAASCVPASGTVFAIGSTTVNCSATDAAGNTANAGFAVTVSDATPPVLVLPSPVVEATSAAGAIVNYAATATDASAVTVTCVPPSGSQFALGSTTVNCTATDASGNSTTGSFAVVVRDTTAPTITTPSPIVEATGPGGAIVAYLVTATDLVSGAVATSCAPASNTLFALGTTEVTCTASDAAGNTATEKFNVVVRDTTPPVITTPSPIEEATSPAGATVLFAATATDLVSGAVAPSCAPAPGGVFAVGSTEVTCTATDGAGNTATKKFNVVVRDTTPPVLTLPAPVAEATGPAGASVVFAATGTDTVSNPVTVSCVPVSGSTFALGTTSVDCTGTDSRGNSTTGTFVVTVRDTTPPAVTVPANFTVGATLPLGAIVNYNATAIDLVDGPRPLSCVPASGTLFAVGTTTVTCSGASDTRGNTAAAQSFQVTVTNLPPVMTQPNIVTTATSPSGAVVTFTPLVVDASDPHPVVACSKASGSTFPIGTTSVTCTATNYLHLTGSVTFTVTVNHSAPVCTAAAPSASSLWPPNHKLTSITVKGLTTADKGAITTTISTIRQDEPTNGLGDGDTAIDGFGVGTSKAQVRVERSGNGDGRFYYIGFTATTPGGSCSGVVTVSVPHDQGHAPVGQGPLFDSTH